MNVLTDPVGSMQQAVEFLASTVLPGLIDLLRPDFTIEGFVRLYAGSMVLSMTVLAILSVFTIISMRRGGTSGEDAIRSLAGYTPAVIAGMAFGPALAMVFSGVVWTITDAIAEWGLKQTMTTFLQGFAARISDEDAVGLLGGAFLSAIIFLGLIAALLGAGFLLIGQLAITYLLVAIIPIGVAWLANPKTRRVTKMFTLVLLIIMTTPATLTFMLSVAFGLAAALGLEFSQPTAPGEEQQQPLQFFVSVVITLMVLLLAVFGPMTLLSVFNKAVPVQGAGQASGGGLNRPDIPTPGSPGDKPTRTHDTANSGPSGTPSAEPGLTPDTVGPKAGSPAAARTAASSGGTAGTGTGAATAGAGAGAGAASAGAAGAGAAGAGAGAAGTAAAGTAAAGTAATATGAGAPVGVPMILAAAAVAGAAKGAELANRAMDFLDDQAMYAGEAVEGEYV
ncbi:hypothetical protein ASG80_21465 [Agromyces sp. Soil535]|nr:hypothetical protein ASG80_21465 [Agromyces sp. Soil535]